MSATAPASIPGFPEFKRLITSLFTINKNAINHIDFCDPSTTFDKLVQLLALMPEEPQHINLEEFNQLHAFTDTLIGNAILLSAILHRKYNPTHSTISECMAIHITRSLHIAHQIASHSNLLRMERIIRSHLEGKANEEEQRLDASERDLRPDDAWLAQLQAVFRDFN